MSSYSSSYYSLSVEDLILLANERNIPLNQSIEGLIRALEAYDYRTRMVNILDRSHGRIPRRDPWSFDYGGEESATVSYPDTYTYQSVRRRTSDLVSRGSESAADRLRRRMVNILDENTGRAAPRENAWSFDYDGPSQRSSSPRRRR
jgi:hypothetical protein